MKTYNECLSCGIECDKAADIWDKCPKCQSDDTSGFKKIYLTTYPLDEEKAGKLLAFFYFSLLDIIVKIESTVA